MLGLLAGIAYILVIGLVIVVGLKLIFAILEMPGRIRRLEDRVEKLEKEKK